ncbi:MAG: flagellar basal-body rod protein FlgG [Nitrospinota bacterium]|nr:flagellar basal-body rod protein FlgG [Nitrospinota bacterium]
MIRSLFTASTGMKAQDLNVSVIANNLANVNTVGFKRSRADFQDLLYQTLRLVGTLSQNGNTVPTGMQLGMGVKPAAIQKNFLQGDFVQTENELDLAIQGKGFFQILQPSGIIAYTRGGSFKLDNVGQIVNSDGLLLTPAITVPPNSLALSIDPQGTVSVTQAGTPVPAVIGNVQLATFLNPAGLSAIGFNLFEQSNASGPPTLGNPGILDRGSVQQGFLELSNVSVVEEMVSLITAQRAYEVNSKTVQAADEMLQISNNLRR